MRLQLLVPWILCLGVSFPSQVTAHPISLWEIKTNSAHLFLLGSVHVARPDLYPLPQAMTRAFDEATTVVFEVDMTQESPADVAKSMSARGRFPPGQTLAGVLQPETRKALSAWLASRGIPYDRVEWVRPWLLSLNLQLEEFERLGYQPKLGVDQHFRRLAIQSGKSIRQLETVKEQIDLLANNPPAVQDVELRATLETLGTTGDLAGKMMSAWQAGQADRLYKLSMDSADRYPLLHDWIDRLTVQRNHRMANKIRGYLARGGKWLVVVGVLHMGGPEGLVRLLGKDYPVRQLDDSASPEKATKNQEKNQLKQ